MVLGISMQRLQHYTGNLLLYCSDFTSIKDWKGLAFDEWKCLMSENGAEFENGQMDIHDGACTCWPGTSKMDANTATVQELILENQWVTIQDLSLQWSCPFDLKWKWLCEWLQI